MLASRPSLTDFPGIREPAPSITWSLDALRDDPGWRGRARLAEILHDAFAACTPPGRPLLLLDWQHTCWALRPDLPPTDRFLAAVVEGRAHPGWPLGPYPDGDYHLLLADDLSHGTFGHPWEHSLCLFGAPLLERAADAVHRLLPTVLRRDGLPVPVAEKAGPAVGGGVVRYVKVVWWHDFPDEPVEFLSGLDADGYEVRKVEVYRDGRLQWADASHETPTIGLGEVPFPPVEEIDALEDFTACPITAEAFEAAWTAARADLSTLGLDADA